MSDNKQGATKAETTTDRVNDIDVAHIAANGIDYAQYQLQGKDWRPGDVARTGFAEDGRGWTVVLICETGNPGIWNAIWTSHGGTLTIDVRGYIVGASKLVKIRGDCA